MPPRARETRARICHLATHPLLHFLQHRTAIPAIGREFSIGMRAQSNECVLAPSRFNEITRLIVAKAIEVHRTLGPGLLESVYLHCLVFELLRAGLTVEVQKTLPVHYKDTILECGNRVDILVEGKVIVEIKAVDQLAPIHQAQMMTYLRLADCRVGLILNFNVRTMVEGIKRVMNGYEE
jgi:GxxExxY protein